MIRHLLLGFAVWFVALLLFAVALQNPAPPAEPAAESWSITQTRRAHQALIVDVVAPRAGDARAIAARIVEPVKGRYHEILVYVRGPGEHGAPSVRRIQWTPRGGYAELVIRD